MKAEWRYNDDDVEVVVRFKTAIPERRLRGAREAVHRVQRQNRIALAWAHNEAGMTYSDISAAVGITRQAARKHAPILARPVSANRDCSDRVVGSTTNQLRQLSRAPRPRRVTTPRSRQPP